MKGKKPVIFIVTNVYFPAIGGISTYIAVLARALKSRGYEVLIRSYPLGMARKEEMIKNRAIRLLVHELMIVAFALAVMSRVLALKLKGHKVIVHSQSASFCLGAGVVSRQLGSSSVHTFHSPLTKCSLRLTALLPLSQELVCVSEEHRSLYERHCGIPPDTRIIAGGVDCDLYSVPRPEEREATRLEILDGLGLGGKRGPIVLFVGRVVKEKGVYVLLQAARTVFGEIPDATFLIVGPLDESVGQIEQVRTLKEEIEPGMRFLLVGKTDVERLRKYYRASDIMVCPSLWEEGSPMVIAEALASGLPIVASGIGGLKSRIENGVNGRLVKPGDSAELASAILELLSDKGKLAAMGRESRRLALERFSDNAMADSYEAVYRQLIQY